MPEHRADEDKPCSECRLQLILAGVDPTAINNIKTLDQAKDLLAEYTTRTMTNHKIRRSLEMANSGNTYRICKSLCHTLPEHTVIRKNKYGYKYGQVKCKTCDVWFDKSQVTWTRCRCCNQRLSGTFNFHPTVKKAS